MIIQIFNIIINIFYMIILVFSHSILYMVVSNPETEKNFPKRNFKKKLILKPKPKPKLITCAQNTLQQGGNPSRKSYNFKKKDRSEYMVNNTTCQLCKIKKSRECAHIYSGDPKGPRYNGKCYLHTIKSKKNMLAMCKKCHIEIDKKNPKNYTAKFLKSLK